MSYLLIIISIVVTCVILLSILSLYLYKKKYSKLESAYIKGFLSKFNIKTNSSKNTNISNKNSTLLNVDNSTLSNNDNSTLSNDDNSTLSNDDNSTLSNDDNSKSSNVDNSSKTNDDKEPSSLDKIANISKDVFSNPNLYVAVGIDVALREIIKKALNKVSQKALAKLSFKAEELFLKTTGKVLQKIGLDKGGKYLIKLGLKAGEKAGQKAAEELALKAGIKVGEKIGEKVAAQSVIALSTGPGAPFVEAALMAFDILSIGLDLTDALIPGGTVGYAKMGTIQQYQEMRDGIMKEMKSAFEAEGGTFPAVVGPLDKFSKDEYNSKLADETLKIMSNPIDPLIKPMFDKIIEDTKSGKLSESDINDDTIMNTYYDLLDMDKINDKADDNLCITMNGKQVDVGNGKLMCSYSNRNTCETSYTWPLKEDSDETYVEYKNNLYGGSCVTASYALRGICQTNNLPYDSETGICKIDEKYCKSKGADWMYNDNIKAYDCGIDKSQDVAELILGTTIVRGLKQVFDPEQYEKCKPGEIENVYGCSSCNEDEETSTGLNTAGAVFTGSALALTGGLNMCYPKCKTGYTGVGPVCWENCPDGFTDLGAFCSKGGDVYAKSTRGADKESCNNGQRDDGVSCWEDEYDRGAGRFRDTSCPAGWRNDGITCWEPIAGGGCRGGDCKTVDNGYENLTWGAAFCNGPKKDETHAPWWLGGGHTGWNDCTSTHIIKLETSCNPIVCDPLTGGKSKAVDFSCHDDEDMNGLLCYPKCKSGFHAVGCCLCSPDGHVGGYIAKDLGSRLSCHDDENNVAGVCWKKCTDGYDDDGAFCRKPIETLVKKSDTRGAGHLADTKIKKRVIDYSTKDN